MSSNLNKNQVGTIVKKNFQFTLTIGIGGASTLISFLLIWGYASADKSSTLKDTIDFTVKTITAAAAVTSAFYVGESINKTIEIQNKIEDNRKEEQNKLEKERRAIAFIARWNGSEINNARQEFASFVRDKVKDKDENACNLVIEEFISNNKSGDFIISHILNFLEEVSEAIISSYADETILKNYFEYIFYKHKHVLSGFIKKRQKDQSSIVYEKFVKVNQQWNYQPTRTG